MWEVDCQQRGWTEATDKPDRNEAAICTVCGGISVEDALTNLAPVAETVTKSVIVTRD